jgi:hypothetical protein
MGRRPSDRQVAEELPEAGLARRDGGTAAQVDATMYPACRDRAKNFPAPRISLFDHMHATLPWFGEPAQNRPCLG